MSHDKSFFAIEDLEHRIAAFKHRDDIIDLVRPGAIAVELGVAEGSFSARILKSEKVAHLYSIDMWAGDRGHNILQYKIAVKQLDAFRNRNSLLRMRFDEALDLFPDDYFDFIYVDGYAHTGQEQGQTLRDWFPKLKQGGIFAGDDYSPEWPLVIQEVNRFMAEKFLKLYVIHFDKEEDRFSLYPTWLAQKSLTTNSVSTLF